MTPAELATIPDPVPAGGEGSRGLQSGLAGRPAGAAPGDSTRPPGVTGTPEPTPQADSSKERAGSAPGGLSGGHLWQVQIYACPDLAQADRVAKDAARRLGVGYVIRYEERLYKIRLGAYASESDALALRERAIREGFPGAFRVWVEAEPNDDRK